MEIKVIEAPQAPLRRMDPSEVLADRNPVYVLLDAEITLELEGRCVVTYPRGQVAAPAIVANALVQAGGEIIGSSIPRTVEKKQGPLKGFATPTRGGTAGCVRFKA